MQSEPSDVGPPSESAELPRYALIGHPADLEHLYRYLRHYKPGLKFKSDATATTLFNWMPPYRDRDLAALPGRGGVSRGMYVMCPVLPGMVLAKEGFKPEALKLARKKVIAACQKAAEEGASVAALGGFTSIAIGGREAQVGQESGLAVTSGNTLTAVLAVAGVERAVEWSGGRLEELGVAVIGASGDIGSAVCRALDGRVRELRLLARTESRLRRLASSLSGPTRVVLDVAEALDGIDVIVTAASNTSLEPVVGADVVQPGTIVCDIGYPKNSAQSLADSAEIFAFAGGLARPPVTLEFGFDAGLPAPGVLYGCFCEAMVLALESRLESYSAGRGNITVERMQWVREAAARNGFELGPFYAGHRELTEADAARVGAIRRARARGR